MPLPTGDLVEPVDLVKHPMSAIVCLAPLFYKFNATSTATAVPQQIQTDKQTQLPQDPYQSNRLDAQKSWNRDLSKIWDKPVWIHGLMLLREI